MKIFNYKQFIKENRSYTNIPTYDECVEMCNRIDSPFYESKTEYDGYPISIFNYRLASYDDFDNPLKDKPYIKGNEMRGITFVFNKDGSLYNRFLLLEKFFNLNQVPDSMYHVVKDYKIKYINNKEDGSIASFIKLPNGKIIGKSKMGFDNDQAVGINRIYKTNEDIKSFVDWCFNNNIIPIFEYVSPFNRIVLKYSNEELILLRLRNNKTGKHIDIKEHLDKIGSIKIAPFEDDHTLDELIELSKSVEDKEGWVVQFDNDKMIKIKTKWYLDLHSIYTNDLYHENKLIELIINDKIDDILGQIPENEIQLHDRINKIIYIVKKSLKEKELEIKKAYSDFIKSGLSKKEYAINNKKGNPNFSFVMNMLKIEELKKMSYDEIIDKFNSIEEYDIFLSDAIEKYEPHNMAKEWILYETSKLKIAREWLEKKDPSLFFKDIDEK